MQKKQERNWKNKEFYIRTISQNLKNKRKIERIDYMNKVPIWEKMTLTPEEAAAYSNIGINKIRSMANEPQCPFVVFVGNRKLIKRKEFEKYISVRNTI